MAIPSTTLDLFERLEHSDLGTGIKVVKDLAVFIDTHRDHPHVGTFHPDIHRGECRPTTVHARIFHKPTTGIDREQRIIQIVHPETGVILDVHPKHLFVSTEWYETWFVNWIMEHGTGPLDEEGKMVTTHFRNPREKKYDLKTFGYMVRLRADKEGVR